MVASLICRGNWYAGNEPLSFGKLLMEFICDMLQNGWWQVLFGARRGNENRLLGQVNMAFNGK